MTALSARLRSETRREHVLAEATRLARAFFAGRLDAHAYALGLVRMEPVYEALETSLATSAEPLLRAFDRPELHRLAALRSDLAALGRPSPTTPNAYAARIRLVARDEPIALLGHFYVRYFADLSGGAVVGRVAPRLFRLPRGLEPAYFAFPAIEDRTAYKDELRAYLDAIPRMHHDVVVDEARRAFLLHRELVDALFDELERTSTPPRALVPDRPP
ncbi:biliverdin-producing heme oxygenase [Sandaracinus amylolyticus]|uniref:Heme oxygenase n=1 Tax=Sandaracinus amylolyticus TaxID=927083 RepID=A0A0F6YH52_9BACT|nr:biliverdin-producing heme oxygenase [Sandaracinus amylolyticus]AKF04607.1 Heme oxygenase [Sandaracinus amylolyticus]